jgi:hypothetical protein
MVDPLGMLLELDRLVDQARAALQYSDESQPHLERRIRRLLFLVERRDRLLSAAPAERRRTGRARATATP